MKKILISMIVMVFLLMACTVMAMGVDGRRLDVVVSIPVLPRLVVMEQESYYYRGYYYHYTNDRWYYSKSKGGHRRDLPRSHYAKEVKYKEKHWKYDEGRNRYHQTDNRRQYKWKKDRGNDDRDGDRR